LKPHNYSAGQRNTEKRGHTYVTRAALEPMIPWSKTTHVLDRTVAGTSIVVCHRNSMAVCVIKVLTPNSGICAVLRSMKSYDKIGWTGVVLA